MDSLGEGTGRGLPHRPTSGRGGHALVPAQTGGGDQAGRIAGDRGGPRMRAPHRRRARRSLPRRRPAGRRGRRQAGRQRAPLDHRPHRRHPRIHPRQPRLGQLPGARGRRRSIVVGVAHFPAMRETFFASHGGGACCNGGPHARLLHRYGLPGRALHQQPERHAAGIAFAPRLLEWMEPFWAVRSMGGCLDAMMLARGQADLWLEAHRQALGFRRRQGHRGRGRGAFLRFRRAAIPSTAATASLRRPGLEAEARRLLAMR